VACKASLSDRCEPIVKLCASSKTHMSERTKPTRTQQLAPRTGKNQSPAEQQSEPAVAKIKSVRNAQHDAAPRVGKAVASCSSAQQESRVGSSHSVGAPPRRSSAGSQGKVAHQDEPAPRLGRRKSDSGQHQLQMPQQAEHEPRLGRRKSDASQHEQLMGKQLTDVAPRMGRRLSDATLHQEAGPRMGRRLSDASSAMMGKASTEASAAMGKSSTTESGTRNGRRLSDATFFQEAPVGKKKGVATRIAAERRAAKSVRIAQEDTEVSAQKRGSLTSKLSTLLAQDRRPATAGVGGSASTPLLPTSNKSPSLKSASTWASHVLAPQLRAPSSSCGLGSAFRASSSGLSGASTTASSNSSASSSKYQAQLGSTSSSSGGSSSSAFSTPVKPAQRVRKASISHIQTQFGADAKSGRRQIEACRDVAEFYVLGKTVMPSCHHDMEIRFATKKANQRSVVIKVRRKPDSFSSSREEQEWRDSTEMVMNLPYCPCIARVEEVLEDDDGYYVVMEKVSGLDLAESLQDEGGLSTENVKEVLRQLITAVAELHAAGCIHKDLKLENVMLDRESLSAASTAPGTPVKIIDFDTVEDWCPKSPKATTVLGTDQYIAPEAYDGNYSPASDIFAVGVIAYYLLTGYFPFDDEIFDDQPGQNRAGSPKMREIRKKLTSQCVDMEWADLGFMGHKERILAQHLLGRMLSVDELSRPTAREALNDPWLNLRPQSARSVGSLESFGTCSRSSSLMSASVG